MLPFMHVYTAVYSTTKQHCDTDQVFNANSTHSITSWSELEFYWFIQSERYSCIYKQIKAWNNLYVEGQVNSGYVNFTASWSPDGKQPFVVLLKEQLRLCDVVQEVRISCPIRTGYHEIVYQNAVPSIFQQLVQYKLIVYV